MIFVAGGSQKFPFDRLIEGLDRLLEEGTLKEEVFAQTGACTYVPRNMKSVDFLDSSAFSEKIRQCSLMIVHAGTGAITAGLTAGKPIIVVPRIATYGEHVDDHQFMIARRFAQESYVVCVEDMEQLGAAIQKIESTPLRPYENDSVAIQTYLCDFIDGNIQARRGKRLAKTTRDV